MITTISTETTATGYVCKSCGNASPMGVGYAVDGVEAREASRGVTVCGCGYSVSPRRPVSLAKAKRLATRKPAHMSDIELMERYRADRETAVASTGTRYEVFNTSALQVLGEMRVREQAGVWFAKELLASELGVRVGDLPVWG